MGNKLNQFDDIQEGRSKKKHVNNDKLQEELKMQEFNLEDIITPNQNNKKKRELVSVYFYKEDMDKLKTLSVKHNSPISKIIEECMQKLTANVVIEEEKVEEYNKSKNSK